MKTKVLFILIIALVLISNVMTGQNYALYFDGNNDKVGVLDSPELNPAEALTMEVWINAETWESSIWAGVLISKQGTNPDKGYGFTVGENGRIESNYSIDEGWVAVNTGQILGLNTWYHLASVYNGTSMKLYVNGILQSTIDVSGTPTTSEGVVMNFGDNPTWQGRFFNGILDEIRIWNVPRSEQEIQEYMTVELTGNEEGLVGYWPMNEGAGNTIGDLTGNENTGTLLNMDETNWVDGFTPPGNDVGIIGIASPSKIGNGFGSEEWIKVDIKNYATDEITGFDVSYQIDGGDLTTETIDAIIAPFGTYIYTFQNTVNLSGLSEIEITAFTGLEGDTNPENDTLTETISQTNNYYLFDQEQHNYGGFGQSHTTALYMPSDLSDYSEIYLHVDLECPGGGCDPWDQPAKVNVIKDAVSYEIARYITPYGVACGGWVWDITDFRTLLTDKTEFNSYVQVWGASGWLVTIQLELVQGTPDYPYTILTPLWMEDNWVYGDTAVSYDFPERVININEETDAAKIRMTMSGHGQGNTLNAAEFSNFTHHIWINGEETFEQHLWKDNCDENTCSLQTGNWRPPRSGWCPGQDVQPWEWDLQDYLTPGNELIIDYVLADYTNLLDTGYNGSTHTEPHYRCHTYLIEYSGNPFVGTEEINLTVNSGSIIVFPNPSDGIFTIRSKDATIKSVYLYRIDGSLIFMNENIGLQQYMVRLKQQTNGLYVLKVETETGVSVFKISRQ